ncbi:MAG: undecaprenyl-diphosphate phosphatase [Alphaproteobacteria bacterium]|nr:undecaprenyl-diphosphate phosphatase [Alphaproteobacteria bacterium]
MDIGTVVDACVLGVIEGFTEFLPVSSTGHMLLADHFFGFKNQGGVFEVVIQLGAILAVVAVYFERLWRAVTTLPSRKESRAFALSIILAFLPAAIIGAGLHKFIKEVLFESPALIGIVLLLGGIVILVVERLPKKELYQDSENLPVRTSIGIGLCQCVAMIPGVSRSGATIIGAMLLGVSRKAAAEFSFFLSIPTMIAAAGYDLYKNFGALNSHDLQAIAIGFVVAFLSALLVVRSFIGFISRFGLVPFAWYRIAAGAAVLLALATGL